MNKIQAGKNSHNHSDHHQEDNCLGCQQERKENGMLVDFYERLSRIQTKVGRIRENVTAQQSQKLACRQKLAQMNQLLAKKPEQTLRLIKQHNSKQMGYELASALIERQIKTITENQRLQAIIQQLRMDKLKLQEEAKHHSSHQNYRSFFSKSTQKAQNQSFTNSHPVSQYSDAIDEVHKANESSYFLEKQKDRDTSNSYFLGDENKKYWEEASIRQDQTNFSGFISPVNKEKNKSQDKNQYEGLNLWLYQFKPQQIDQTFIKSLKKPANNKRNLNIQVKHKSKF